jgi:hypothetical protein
MLWLCVKTRILQLFPYFELPICEEPFLPFISGSATEQVIIKLCGDDPVNCRSNCERCEL